MKPVRHAVVLTVLAVGGAYLAAPAGASASAWGCRASVAYADVPGVAHIEPIVANSAFRGCPSDFSGLHDVVVGNSSARISVRGAQARTQTTNASAQPKDQQPAGAAGVAEVKVELGPLAIAAAVLTSDTAGTCAGGAPGVTGSSTVASLSVNGHSVTPDGTFEIVGDGTNGVPVNRILRLSFNRLENAQEPNATYQAWTRRAVDIALLDSGRQSLAHAVIAETRVYRAGNVCSEPGADEPALTCRASVAWLNVAGVTRYDPVVANSSGGPCVRNVSGIYDLTLGGLSAPNGLLRVVQASTGYVPGASGWSGTADGTVAALRLNLAPGLLITADALRSHQEARCVAGAPAFTGESAVANLRVNGAPVSPDDLLRVVATGVNGSPLVYLLRIGVNEVTHSGSAATADESYTRRALHVTLLNGGVDTAVGDTTVGRHLNPC